jgi:hypothetical protein
MNLTEFPNFSCGTLSNLVSTRKIAEKMPFFPDKKTYFSKCGSGNIKVYASIYSPSAAWSFTENQLLSLTMLLRISLFNGLYQNP